MACILFLPDTALAGAWPLSEGKTQTIQTMSFQQMKKRVPPSVILRPAGFGKSVSKTLPVYSTSTVLECALWAEVGLTSRLTAIAELSHKRFIFDDAMSKTDATRLRSFETGLRYTFWYPSQSSALSLQASLLSPSVADGLPYDDFDQDRGGFDLRLLGGLSFSLAGRSGFFDIQAAHRHYTNRYQENRIQLTLGLDVKTSWSLFFGTEFIKRHFYSTWPSEDEIKISLSLLKKVNHQWSLQMGQRFEVIRHRPAHRHSMFLSLWRRF